MGQKQSVQKKWEHEDGNLAVEGKKLFSKFYEAQHIEDKADFGKAKVADVLERLNSRVMKLFPTIANSYVVEHLIATGSTGLVCKLRHKTTKQLLAAKIVRLPFESTGDHALALSHFRLEAQLQKKCAHDNVVKLVDFEVANDFVIFLMEYVPNTLLETIVKANRSGSYSEMSAARYIRQVATALQVCHSQGIVHLDVKLDNILCDGGVVKLCDFGLADYAPVNRDIGTALFCSPEILLNGVADTKSDMWSLGVVLFILLCGYPPFQQGSHGRSLNENIVGARYQFISPYWDAVSGLARDLVAKLLIKDKDQRFSAKQVLEHPWIVSCCQEEPQSTGGAKPTTKPVTIFQHRKLSNTSENLEKLNQMREMEKRSFRSSSSLRALDMDVHSSQRFRTVTSGGMRDVTSTSLPVVSKSEPPRPSPGTRPNPLSHVTTSVPVVHRTHSMHETARAKEAALKSPHSSASSSVTSPTGSGARAGPGEHTCPLATGHGDGGGEGGVDGTPTRMLRRSLSSLHKRPTWVPDHEAEACRICGSDFNLLLRKHHCRACGQVICENCSMTRRIVASVNPNQPVRVCDRCRVTSNKNTSAYDPGGKKYHATSSKHGRTSLVFGL